MEEITEKLQLQTQVDYRVIRHMLSALAEKIIWRHKYLCEGEEDVTIDALANVFVQEHGDEVLLDIVEKLTKIYQRQTERFQIIVRIEGDPFKTELRSFPSLMECVQFAKSCAFTYPGNHEYTIIDTNFETREVYDNEEVREMMEKGDPEKKAYSVELTYNYHRKLRVMASNEDEALDNARETPITISNTNLQEVDCYVEEIKS
jgi:hypothetical protein